MNEDRAARYQRLRRRAIVAAAAWSLILPAGVLATGASLALRDAAEGVVRQLPWTGWAGTLAATVVFVTGLFAIHEAGALPLSYFAGHVLERRYGLSRQSAWQWGRDHLKLLAIGWGVAVAAGGVTIVSIRVWPDTWWLVWWGTAVAFSAVVAWVGPVWLLPLFYKFFPLANASLRQRLADLAARAGVPVLGVFEWRLSDRTSRANAALAGLGRTRRILVSDTLLADYQEDEVEVILAHELSHHVHHDIWRALALEAAVLGLAGWCAGMTLPALARLSGAAGPGDLAALPAVALMVLLVSTCCVPIVNAAARAHERRADRFALALTDKPEAFARAIRRLAARNLAEDDPSRLVRLLFSTHPTVRQRLDLARHWGSRSS